MNSEENNELQIKKLERMERIYADTEKHESVIDSIDTEPSDFCAPIRKVFKWILLIIWLACVAILITGGDFTLPASGILFSGGVYRVRASLSRRGCRKSGGCCSCRPPSSEDA